MPGTTIPIRQLRRHVLRSFLVNAVQLNLRLGKRIELRKLSASITSLEVDCEVAV